MTTEKLITDINIILEALNNNDIKDASSMLQDILEDLILNALLDED